MALLSLGDFAGAALKTASSALGIQSVNSQLSSALGTFSGSAPNASEHYMIHISAPDRFSAPISAYLPESYSMAVASEYEQPFANGSGGSEIKEKLRLALQVAGYSTTTQIMSMQVWQGTAPIDLEIPMTFKLGNNGPEQDILTPMRNLMSLALPSTKASASGSNGASPLGLTGGTSTGAGSTLAGDTSGVMVSPGPKIRLKQGNSISSNVASAADRAESGFGSLLSSLSPSSIKDTVSSATKSIGNSISSDYTNITQGSFADLVNSAGNDAASATNNLNFFKNFEVYDNISISLGKFFMLPSVVITSVSQESEIKLDKLHQKPISVTLNVGIRTFVNPKAEDLINMIPSAA